MEQDTLTAILGAEKEIRDKLDAERDQAGRWLEHARGEIEQAHRSALAQLQDSADQGESAARQAASDKAARIVLEATTTARDIDRFRDDELRRFIRRHIACIAPGMPP